MNRKEFSTGMGAVALAVAVALSGCGGSGGGGTTSSVTGSGTTTVGMITGFGSVYVNGVEYESDGASISIDGESGNDDYDLEVGMTVAVTGTVNPDGVTGTATAITYADELEGVVLENNVTADGSGTLNIMGQTVMVTSTTIFESHVSGVSSLDGIAPGNVVEVSGYSDGDGSVFATRIEVKAADLASYQADNPGSEIELKGLVSGLDTTAQSFSLGSLIVDYASATYVTSELDDGLYVEVKSDSAPSDNGDGTFTLSATKVELEDDGIKGLSGEEGDEIEYQGVITSIDAMPEAFDLNGQPILLNDETEFEDELLGSDLTVGDVVQVEAYFNAAGDLVADSVEPEGDDNLSEFEDYVLSVDAANNSLTLQGGQVIIVDNSTIMQDSLDSNADHYFDLSDLRAGDFVEIHAATDANGDLLAVKLERDDDPNS